MVTTSAARHTPYDGSAQPFTIGLQQLDLKDWIEIDDNLLAYLAEKERLFALYGDRIFVEETGNRRCPKGSAGAPQPPISSSTILRSTPATARTSTLPDGTNPYRSAKRISPPCIAPPVSFRKTLCLMRKDEQRGWHLAAASLSFPSSWTLLEKFGRSMDDIHAPVPDFGAGTRNAGLITRMFDNLRPDRSV